MMRMLGQVRFYAFAIGHLCHFWSAKGLRALIFRMYFELK